VLASKGFQVTGADLDESKVDSVNAGVSPIYEPRLQELIVANRDKLVATTNAEEAVIKTDATFIVVPTPSEESGEFSLRYVTAAVERVGDALRRKNDYHLVTLTSTIMPGSIGSTVAPLLEERSGKRMGEYIGLCYSPEFIALGDVIRGLLEPDLVLIGESDRRAGSLLSAIKHKMCDKPPAIAHMNFVNAEMAKIALNSFVTMKMSFANTLAELCENVAGADVDTVTSAIGLDKRIGRSNLKGALGYGGPCFPRDNIAFAQFARRRGVQADLALATHSVNLRQVARVLGLIESECDENAGVAVLGLAYKANTNVLEGSQSMTLVNELSKRGYQVHVYDPAIAQGQGPAQLGPNVHLENGAKECLAEAEVCIIATPWTVFSQIESELFTGKTVIDCWRILPKEIQDAARYIPIGSHGPARQTSLKQLKSSLVQRRH
jgi:UDPglucose 6-dehydrogenase